MKDKLIEAAHKTWSQIGYDAHALCEEYGDQLTNEAAIEFILDADRISTYGDFDPFDETNNMSWNEVVEILDKIQFV